MSMLTWLYNHLPNIINKRAHHSFLNKRATSRPLRDDTEEDEMSFSSTEYRASSATNQRH